MSARRFAITAALLAVACTREASAPAIEGAVRLASFADGARVTDTRLPLEALAPSDGAFDEVDYAIDGARVATRVAAPWGWGDGGARVRDAGEMSFGAHEIRVDARTKSGHALRSALHVVYLPPTSGVPSYARDVVSLFRAHCASCHDRGGLARDLADYERLSDMIPRLRASIREGRMPPDFAIDAPTVAVFTAWCDGYAPR